MKSILYSATPLAGLARPGQGRPGTPRLNPAIRKRLRTLGLAAILASGAEGFSHGATINYVGTLQDSPEAAGWLSPSVPKTYDVDGDNKYGSFAGIFWGQYTNYSAGTISGDFSTITNVVVNSMPGLYANVDSLADACQGRTGAGALINDFPIQDSSQLLQLNSGNQSFFVTNISSGSYIWHTFQVNANLTGKTLRVGIMTDAYGTSLQVNPHSQDSGKGLWIVQTAGGTASSVIAPVPAGVATGETLPDMTFFDIVDAQAGDQFRICEKRTLYLWSNPYPYLSQISFDVNNTASVPSTVPFINTNVTTGFLGGNPVLYPPFSNYGSGRVRTNCSYRIDVLAGSAKPVTYQWLKNGLPISNATNAVYEIGNATQADAGNYQAVVSNASGSVTGSVSTLSVTSDPVAPATAAFRARAFSTPGLYAYYGFDNGPRDMKGTNDGYLMGTPGAGASIGTGFGSGPGENNGTLAELGFHTYGGGVMQVPYNPVFDFNNGNQEGTIVVWMRPEWIWTGGYNAPFAMASGTHPGNMRWGLNVGRSKAGMAANNGTNNMNASIPNQNMDVNKWYMLTAVFSNGTYKGYCNGVLLGASSAANPTNQPFGLGRISGLPLTIGAMDETGTNNWSGGLDEIAIYTNALSDAQVQALFTSSDLPYGVTQPVGGSFAPGDIYALSFACSNNWSRVAAAPANPLTAFVPSTVNYQWYTNGVALPGGTSSSISFEGFKPSDAATYVCVASNVSGAITSTPALITIAYPQLQVQAAGSHATITWPSSYTRSGWFLESTPTVSPTSWTPVATNSPAIVPAGAVEEYFRLSRPY